MKQFYIGLFGLLLAYSAQSQSLVINEFSQGVNVSPGTKEYFEFVVVGTRTCTDSTMDLRRWIFDDNNGWYGSGGNAAGFVRFRNVAQWSAIPYGSIIVVYNSSDKNPEIPADDPTDANNDGVYIIPISSNLLEHTTSGGNYSTTNLTTNSSGNQWNTLSLRNSGDAVILVNPNNTSVAAHAIAYGSNVNAQNRPANINMPGSGGGVNYYLTDANYNTQTSWLEGVAGVDETPGAPNSPANAAWINAMRRPVSNNAMTVRDTVRICANALPYSWRGNNVNRFGDSVATHSLGACDTTYILSLYAKPVDSVTNNTSVCINNLPFTWNGQTVTTAGSHRLRYVTSSAVTGCDSISILNLTVNNFNQVTRFDTICYNALPYTWNGQTINTSGSFSLLDTISSSASCDTIINLRLFVRNAITSTITNTICQSQLPFTWNGKTVNTVGAHTLVDTSLTAITRCDSVTTLHLTVNASSTVNIVRNICEKQLPFTWNGKTVNTLGTHTLRDTTSAANGCDSFTILTLNVGAESIDTVFANVCYADLPYRFNNNTYTTPGTYTATFINRAGCDSIVRLVLSIGVPPVDSSVTITGCDSVLFKNVWYKNNVLLADTVFNANGCDSIYRNVTLFVKQSANHHDSATICENSFYTYHNKTFRTPGIHKVTYAASNGCDSNFYLHLSVNQLPELSISIDPLARFCVGDTLSVHYAGASYLYWDPVPTYTSQSGVGFILNPGQNTFTLFGENGSDCKSQKSITIDAEECCEIAIPNAFTPNNDGLNDEFKVIIPGNPEFYSILVFDRYGTVVFRSIDHNVGWNGYYKGEAVNLGVYYYMIEFECNGQKKIMKGDITLLR